VNDDDTSTTTSFELVIIFPIISANLFTLLFHFLINDVRMTTFTHQLLSRKTSTPEVWQCECEYSSRSAACPSLYCAWAMQKSFSF